jgi:uncharacterized LabA/DUF88 family protein
VGIFIDVENLYYSAKKLFGERVNFRQLLKDIVGPRKLIRAVAYVIRTETGEESSFFDALSRLGIEIKVKDLQVYGGFKKADWDVGIAVDAIKISPLLDVVIILSGDGDFLPLVEYLKNLGKQVEVASFSKSTSSKIKESVDHFFDIGKSKKYLYKK